MALSEAQKKERSEYLERNLEITECSQGKPYVFISYASDNWKTVFKDAVVPLQQMYGLRIYADKAFDEVNDKWIVPMLRNIRGADAVMVFISQSYIESYACFLELLKAVNSRKPIIFVSLGQELSLGDSTALPVVERGVKHEILNQGSDLSTNTNNTSNDLLRAMKSAYTSISTLLEQDALSKFDISDAFINFFRDASVNQKTINDLKAVKRTIGSVSNEVFDKTLIIKSEKSPVPARQPMEQVIVPAMQPMARPIVPEREEQSNITTEPPEGQAAATMQPEEPAAYHHNFGENVAKKPQCANCGRELSEGVKFCKHCGHKISDEIAQADQSAVLVTQQYQPVTQQPQPQPQPVRRQYQPVGYSHDEVDNRIAPKDLEEARNFRIISIVVCVLLWLFVFFFPLWYISFIPASAAIAACINYHKAGKAYTKAQFETATRKGKTSLWVVAISTIIWLVILFLAVVFS